MLLAACLAGKEGAAQELDVLADALEQVWLCATLPGNLKAKAVSLQKCDDDDDEWLMNNPGVRIPLHPFQISNFIYDISCQNTFFFTLWNGY